ncbi:MAG: ribosome maturation factor RimP [Gammaproteobacteria bacterium]
MARVERKALIEWLEPEVSGLGYELLDIEWVSGRGSTLRLFIDAEAGVGLDDCERVSRAVEALLDVKDTIPVEYRLEVSSPGIERPLRTVAHFAAVRGQRVRLQVREADNAVRKLKVELVDIEGENLVVDNGSEQRTVALEDVISARLAPMDEAKTASRKKGKRSQ